MPEIISYPRFISNTPCGIDLFESGSQEKTAKSISDHIKEGNSDYKLIGLDGEWGSGKSNAISIIEKQLGGDYHIFVYDTWAHQEDLQRRSFLEELTDNLQTNNAVNRAEWRSKLNDLLAKKKTTITKTIPTLSYAIIASLLVAAIAPITKVISDSLPPDKAFLKFLVAASPLLVAILVWIIAAIRDSQYWDLTQLFRIYEKQDLKKISDETISESEPSLKEFRNWMHKLNEDSKKKIVIVFDNMDRLPPEKIKIIWALLHTFFSSKPYSKIWVIVPFDRSHIRDAFGKKEDDKEFEKTNHFINKTFSVIFNISPAVLTDWKKFFEKKYIDAFGDKEKEEYNITRKIFDLYHTSITPRKIIAFLNDLVSLKLIWQKEIKLRYIAVFVLNRQHIIENPLSQILNKGFLARSQNLFAGDDAVADNIAALLYNVPLEKATQVTLQREIEIAIRQRRIPALKEFSKNVDFLPILEQIQTEDIEVEATTTCLNEIESSFQIPDTDSFQVIWDRVMGRQLNIQLLNLELTEVHKILIIKSRPDQRKRLIRYLLKEFNQIRGFSGSKYFAVLSEIENFLQEKSIDIECLPLIDQKEVTPEIFVDYLNSAEKNYKRYKIICNNELLEKYFIEKAPDNLDDAPIIWHLKGQYKFPALKEALEKIIRGNEVKIENVSLIFDTYKAVSQLKNLTVRLTDQKIYELLTNAEEDSDGYYELAAMRIARGEKFTSQGTADQNILSITDEDFIKEISSRIEYYNDYGSLLIGTIGWPKPVTKSLLKHMTLNGSGSSMAIEKVLPQFNKIVAEIDVPEGSMLNKLNSWSTSLKTKLTTANLQEIIPDCSFYSAALNVENDLTNTILETSVKYINEASQEDWIEAYKDQDSYILRLLHILLKSNKISALPDNAFSVYKETLKTIATSVDEYDISSNTNDVWLLLYNKSDKIHLQATVKDIRDIFVRDVDISAEQFLFFEPLLREQGALLDKSGEVVRKILVPALSDDDCFNTLVLQKEFYASLVDSAGNDAFDFIDTLRGKIETDSGNSLMVEFSNRINEDLAKNIRIIYAKYYSPQKEDSEAIEITDTLKRIIEKEKQIHFKVDNGIVNDIDPDEGNPKNLYVKYSYKGEEKEKKFDEHKWLRLP